MYEKYIIQDEKILQKIEVALLQTYFSEYDQEFLLSEQGRQDIEANVFNRYNHALKYVVPWVSGVIDLSGKNVVEIGCGTGSSTAAFAHFVERIYGYDINKESVAGASARCEILELANVDLEVVSPASLIQELKKKHSDGVDIFLLFAVLEHQTIHERHDTLRACWNLLNDEGLIVVAETPNLLQYTDHHTSLLPFLHMLPSELYALYSKKSPRRRFNASFTNYKNMTHGKLSETITRWGRGVSYHDFEIALGQDYKKYLVCQGFEPEIISWFHVSFEEELLRLYILTKQLDIPLGFTRNVINVIFKKYQGHGAARNNVPEDIFFVEKAALINCEEELNKLKMLFADRESLLQEIVSSRSWKIGRFMTAPYRKLKTKILHS